MLRIGTWIEHPHFGVGRIANHHELRYVTRCYGSLTSLNFLFKRDDEKLSTKS